VCSSDLKLPIDWNGWVIHGDKHNNNVWEYPFINGKNKTINVSAELIEYKPLDIEVLSKLRFEKIRRMDTLSSTPIYS
jgi:calcineurin-like phosphoesterase family protein